MQIWAESGKSALPICNYSQILYQFLTFTQNLKRSPRTGQGLNFVIHQENYLKGFLTDGDIPIDNSASERAVRTFCIGKKNWMFHNTAKGARASALVYSISETAKLNNLRPYYYFRHILTELPKYCDEKGKINPAKLDQLMPWAEELPEECRKPRRS